MVSHLRWMKSVMQVSLRTRIIITDSLLPSQGRQSFDFQYYLPERKVVLWKKYVVYYVIHFLRGTMLLNRKSSNVIRCHVNGNEIVKHITLLLDVHYLKITSHQVLYFITLHTLYKNKKSNFRGPLDKRCVH